MLDYLTEKGLFCIQQLKTSSVNKLVQLAQFKFPPEEGNFYKS